MSATHFKIEHDTFRKLIGNGVRHNVIGAYGTAEQERAYNAVAEADAMLYRLGNMTLMQAGANRDVGNLEYPAKRETYRQSGFAITRRIAEENAEWAPERIAARQRWMADQATAIWRVAQLS